MSNNNNNLVPVGYRFYPTEEELLSFYLQNKLASRREADIERVIPVIDIYKFDPFQLPAMSSGSWEPWFFFCPLQRREAQGGRPTRITPSGYWKATGSPSVVYSIGRAVAIGVKKTMVFYLGKAPRGRKTMWKMTEYRALEGDGTLPPGANPKLRNEFSVCRVYKNLGCMRTLDRRPVTAGNATPSRPSVDNQETAEAAALSGTGTKRARSTDGDDSSPDDDGGSQHGSPPGGAIDPMLLEEFEKFDWEQLWD
ncbi:putative NAC domain-containing protein 90 [Iris pallida]|uniref:NAC domain-containing protein 90 n=1 Tax=Iris pallida TaxID=29817 RepID=A0AAX6EHJ1_IRIPA|nr:putative NAC domain-containing protein 90 [Iris pallida]KAJ6811177.1 putative NAC domain-containing protein 90 [Iris pallida]